MWWLEYYIFISHSKISKTKIVKILYIFKRHIWGTYTDGHKFIFINGMYEDIYAVNQVIKNNREKCGRKLLRLNCILQCFCRWLLLVFVHSEKKVFKFDKLNAICDYFVSYKWIPANFWHTGKKFVLQYCVNIFELSLHLNICYVCIFFSLLLK